MELETGADSAMAAWVLAVALSAVVLSVLIQRVRRQKRLPPGWIPWNGLLFIGIVTAAVAAAHLLGIGQR